MDTESAAPLATPDDLRALLGIAMPSGHAPTETSWEEERDTYTLRRIVYRAGDGDEVPAFLFVPKSQRGSVAGVVVFHQHNGEWHLGKSEVAGLAGDRLQAFAPALAASGVIVLAPDAVCFEDRRRQTTGTQRHPDDARQHYNELSYRLVTGDTLARKVIEDAATAVSVLQGIDGVDEHRVGVLGHSFGGHTALFLAALDTRVSFACASGAAGSYRARMLNEVGIGFDHAIPGIARRMDFDTLVRFIAPRRLLIVAGQRDRYALDAQNIVDKAVSTYRAMRAVDALECRVLPGEHALTRQRHELIREWMTAACRIDNA